MHKPLNLWLHARDEAQLIAYANDAAPLETGGVLLGYRANNALVVTQVIGPGPNATHKMTSFAPDLDYQHRAIAERFTTTGGQETYLGDWHTHPHGSLYLSLKDVRALRKVAHDADSQTRTPVMLLLAGKDKSWGVGAWQLRRAFWWPLTTLQIRRHD